MSKGAEPDPIGQRVVQRLAALPADRGFSQKQVRVFDRMMTATDAPPHPLTQQTPR